METVGDSVFVSRFDDDLIVYSQTRVGFTSSLGAFKVQPFWSDNVTFDVKASILGEILRRRSPGIRFRPQGAPKSLWITVSAVRGAYLVNENNPHRPNYDDFRVGVWYALTK